MNSVRDRSSRRHASPGGIARLWFGVLAAPVAWALQLAIAYMLLPTLCAREASLLPLHAVSAVALALALAGCATAWHAACRATPGARPGGGAPVDRARFMGTLGAALAVLLIALILAQWAMHWVPEPCAG